MKHTEEEWRDVVGYVGEYKISSMGRVQSVARTFTTHRKFKRTHHVLEKILVTALSTTGYKQVHLCSRGSDKTKRVHKMVAEAFLGHIPCGHKEVIDHIDNNKINNEVSNLRLVTTRENVTKGMNLPKSGYRGVSKNGKGWRATIRIEGKRVLLGTFSDPKEAGIAYATARKETVLNDAKQGK